MKWNLRKSDTTLVIGALLTVVVLAWGAISVRTQGSNYLGNAWVYSSSPRAFIESGAGGIEFGNSAWLNGDDLVINVVNPLTEQAVVHLRLKLGASPCGDLPAISLLPVIEKYVKSGVVPGEFDVAVPAKRARQISFKVSGIKCAIKGDPRLFIGSIAIPTVSGWTKR
jgi:hypothetical protein